ncbi:hypothetical protein GMSM_17910 [Geomonas sp. Red276]
MRAGEEKAQRAGDERVQKAGEEKAQKSGDEKAQRAGGGQAPTEPGPAVHKVPAVHPVHDAVQRLRSEFDESHHQDVTNLGEIQRQPAGDKGSAESGAALESAITGRLTGGAPLPAEVRKEMEPYFGADFSSVRIHTDTQAAALSRQLHARAFAYRNHIFFADGQFQPATLAGKELLAHELTHTVQQGHGIKRKNSPPPERPEDILHRAPAAKPPAPEAVTSSEVVDLSSGTLTVSEKVQAEIEAQGAKGLGLRVIVKGVTEEGVIKVRADRKKNIDSFAKGSMKLKAAWADQLGGLYVNFKLVNSEIKNGYSSLKPGGGDTNDWVRGIQKTAEVLGGLGLKVGNFPTPVNKFEGGKVTLGVTGLHVEIGGFLDASVNFAVENVDKPKVEASADINVKGIAKGQLKLDNTKEKLAGELSLGIEYKSFSGNALIKYNPDGTVDIGGKASYSADRLSGMIEFVSTDLETANAFARDAIKAAGGKENVQDAPPPAPVPAPKPNAKKRGLAATGQLSFHLTDWFAGTVCVVVDAKGDVTVIGKVAPPAEILLMKQRDWDIELIKLEAKAYYGIPVVGNINVFANVGLHAIASLGPAKIYNIEILGTYSTDPEIQKMIQISGSINISAYAGLRLRAEGGAGVEILDHDIKFGVGINVDVGVKAYVDARPTVGFRDPGVFYISGTLEMVAQPVLGLGGDFFIALVTPWWSPLSDDRWTWPLFSKEWPLGDPLGISAEMKEYVLGSGKVPEIELKKPEFDPGKFMSKMVDNDMPGKSGKKGDGKGGFKEDGSVKKPEIPPKKPAPKKDAKPAPKKGPPAKAGKSAKPDPKGGKEKDNAKLLQNASKLLAGLKGKGPFTRTELNSELNKIKSQASGVDFDIQQKGNKWSVKPKAGGKVGKGVELNAKDTGKDGAADGRTPAQVLKDLEAAVKEATLLVDDEEKDKGDIEMALPAIKTRYKLTTIKLVEAAEGEEVIVDSVEVTINPTKGTHKKKKKHPHLKTGDKVQVLYNDDWSVDFIKVTKQINQYKWEASGKIDKSRISRTLNARDYGKKWRKYNPYKVGDAWEAIRDLNVWSAYKDASQTLSYRKHARFNVPAGKNWHHIHEQANNGPHSVENLALVDAGLNQGFLNAYFTKSYPETRGVPLRQYLKGKSHETHMKWGRKAIEAAGKTLAKNKDEGRGRYNEIE